MLLQRLSEYATRLDTTPSMYLDQPIRYVVDLAEDGRYLGLTDTADPFNKATQRGTRRLAPHLKRAYGIRPKLLSDTGVYVFGIVPPEERAERVRQQRDAFLELVERCGLATGETTVRAVATFLTDADVAALNLPDDFDPKATLSFRVDGTWPIDLPAVRSFWAGLQAPEEDAGGEQLMCVVCGQVRPALARHPFKIKGIPGGQMSGTDLISANAKAFESYGLSNSLIAPTCQDCAERYANALNALLAGEATHLRVGGLVYVFWTGQPSGFSPASLLSEPEPAEVRELIGAARTGRRGAVGVDTTAFYAIALGASGGRAVVRDWIDTTVGEAQRQLGRYFALQEMVEWDGAPGQPLPIWRLANATVRRGGREEVPASVPSALLGLALGGTPLPLDLLYQAVRRNRAEQGVLRERAMLIKMVLGSRGEGDDAMVELDATNRTPAYLCGRLLAVLEAVQRAALGNPNATIVDKFYGTASSAPASVFGTLLDGAQAHLSKLRKDQRTHAAHAALQQRLMDVMEPLAAFPATLTLQEQGLFALGYYHQRAMDRRAARARHEAREAAAAADEAALATVDGDDEP